MKIATYNVNGIRSRLPVLLKWLAESAPDIACLQELKAPQDAFPLDEINASGYEAIWKGQKSWNGVAILAKKHLAITERKNQLPGDTDDEQSRYLEAEVSGIIIGCIYLPNGNPFPGPKFEYKLSWMSRLHKHASELLGHHKPVILTGDFNVIPEEMDVYNPERVKDDALFQPESRKAFQDILNLGYTDTLRSLFPEEKIYTYWDYFRNAYNRNSGMRIDHFLVNSLTLPGVKSGGVDKHVRGWEKTSDHAPVWIEME
ncbi:MAG TPA: exodeoxyribonuclease III [Ginsengibacter sp.]|nr:exodeoxyribonuclease III [Ginsengibacter sp.]HRP18384.1 exodeoxyribonuclease III [Ginsengibacter sp.]HRP45685.1 exodeoxyribonuclease III [Ginsengibacter sp.]